MLSKLLFLMIMPFGLIMLVGQYVCADTGWLKVTSFPAGVHILADGNPVGSTSPVVSIELTSGSHKLNAKKNGYATQTKNISIKQDKLMTLNITLPAANEKVRSLSDSDELKMLMDVGSIVVVSVPIEQEVKIFGRSKGSTPLKIENYPAGPVQVEVNGVTADFMLKKNSTLRLRCEKNRLFDTDNPTNGALHEKPTAANSGLGIPY